MKSASQNDSPKPDQSGEGALPAIAMIGNAHLDPAWMWQWSEGMEAFIATCRSALDRMRETPGFIFTCSSAAHYRWVEELEPELFAEIAARIREGRWAIAGGWWVQADCNLPSGEGFVRQALLGQRWFHEKFGRTARTGYSPDAFGHSLGLPQLLARAGMTGYVFCRPDPTELALPSPLFRWHGADGSSVLAYRVPFHYNMYETSVPKKVGDLVAAYRNASPLAQAPLEAFAREWMLFYGVGNHGGGPTREQIAQIIAIDADPAAPLLRFGDPDAYFRHIEGLADASPIPSWHDDLQLNAPGCYSAHSEIKRLNRRGEHALMAAERMASLAALLFDAPYPADDLQRAWEGVCFNHFHDILCGVAIGEALADAVCLYGAALTAADVAMRHAVQRIARSIDTTGPGQTLMVANPHAWTVQANVTFELWHDIDKSLWHQPVDVRVCDDEGREVHCQTGFTSGKIGRDRIAVTFAAEAPALGWRCYRVHYGERTALPAPPPLAASATVLENAFLRVEVNAADGTLARIHDKRSNRDVLTGRGAVGLVIDDPTDTWGHGVERFDRTLGEFSGAEVSLVENGPTHATIRARSRWGASWMQHDYRLYRDAAFIEADVKIFWAEQHRMLKLAFDVAAVGPTAMCESAYAVSTKPCDGIERPCGSWTAVVGTGEAPMAAGESVAGLAIVNDAKHGYSALRRMTDAGADGRADSATLMLTALRSPSFATHDPHPFDPDEDLDFLDQGPQRFRYAIHPIADAAWPEAIAREAAHINMPLQVHLESPHPAPRQTFGRRYCGIDVSPGSVQATVLKRSADRTGWTLRLFETAGRGCRSTVHLVPLELRWSVDLAPHEIATYIIRGDAVERVNLAEFPTE